MWVQYIYVHKMATDVKMEILDEKGFRTQIKQWATATSLHAVKYLVEATKLRRMIWIGITLAVTVAFLVQFALSLQMFFRYDSTTSIEQEEYEEITLPSITICNANGFKRSTVGQEDPAMVKTFEQLMEIIYGLRTNTTLTRPESMKQFKFLEFYKHAAHRQEDLFLWCSAGNTVVKCSDYITEAVTNAGLCYTFNSKESIGKNGKLIMREPGPYDGINLILDTEPDDYLIMNGFGVGVRFVIHEPDIIPLLNTGSYFAAPGEETFFSLTKMQTTYLQPPYSTMDCVAEDNLAQKGAELRLGAPYSQEACATVCYFRSVYDCSNCSVTGNGKPICTLYDSLQCGADNGITNQRVRSCSCPRKCQTTSYTATNTHTSIPSSFILQMSEKYNWTVRDKREISRRLILLRVYFDTNTVIKVTQKVAVTLIETLADIGGTLGLYLGASFVTLLEFVDCLAVFCTDFIKSYKSRKEQKKVTTSANKYKTEPIRHIYDDTDEKQKSKQNRFSTAVDYNTDFTGVFSNDLYDTFDNIHTGKPT